MYALTAFLLLPAVLAAEVRVAERNQARLLTFSHVCQVPQFVPPSDGPLVASSNYVGSSNGSLPKTEVVAGKSFNRFIQVRCDSRRA